MAAAILKLHQAGHNAEWIADYLSCELAQVKAVVTSSQPILDNDELARLQDEAQSFRCAYSKRLISKPIRGPDEKLYELSALKKSIKANDTGSISTRPLRALDWEVDWELKDRVKEFSLKALEVAKNCIRSNAHREAAVAFAAECLGVLDGSSHFDEFLGVLTACSKEEQAAILTSLHEFRPSLLKKLRLSLALMPDQSSLTLLLDELSDAKREKVKPKASMSCSSMLLLVWIIPATFIAYSLLSNSTRTEDSFQASLNTMQFDLDQEIEYYRQQTVECRVQGEAALANLYEQAASYLSQDEAFRHLHLDNIFNKLGLLYDNRGDFTRAEEYYLKCLSIRQQVLPAKHPDLASIYNNLGVMYFYKGNYRRSEAYLLKCLSIWQEILPATHPDLALITINLGALYERKGEFTRAEEYYLKCLSIRQEVLPAVHPDLASIYNNLGTLYYNTGDFPRAEKYLLKCLSIWQEVLPATHPDLALISNNLGIMCKDTGDYTRAEEYYLKCLSIRQAVLPANHPDLASIYNNLGSLYFYKGDYRSAEEYYLKCKSIWQEVLPAEHPDIASLYNSLGALYESKGDDRWSEEYVQER
jgi:tetratricopeptide (TPR) repeat protein